MSHTAIADGFSFVFQQNWDLQANDEGNLLKMFLPPNSTECSSGNTAEARQVENCAQNAKDKVCCFDTNAEDVMYKVSPPTMYIHLHSPVAHACF